MMKPSQARASDTATLLVPAILLLAFCLVPFADGIARMLSGDGVSGLLQQDMRAQIASLMSSRVLVLAALSLATAVLCIVLAVPLTYLLTSASRGWRTLWLSMLVVVLSLSETILALVGSALPDGGLVSSSPSFSGHAMAFAGMIFRTLPFTILVLYPPFRQFDGTLVEAAKTMGASPGKVFSTVLVPVFRRTILGTALLGFVFSLGSFLLPQLHVSPPHWTLIVLAHEPGLPAMGAISALALLVALSLAATLLVGSARTGAE